MVCSALLLVVEGHVLGSRVCVQEDGCCTTCSIPLPHPQDACIHVTTLPMRGNQVLYVQYPAILLPSLCILLVLRDLFGVFVNSH
jgi:hypothetical protein